LSREAVFYTAALLVGAICLFAVAAAGQYVRVHGGGWGTVGQVLLVYAAALALLAATLSPPLRAWLRVQLAKHLFHYKYDYRAEWLRLSRTLSAGERHGPLPQRALRAIAQIVDSPGGVLWMREGQGYAPVAEWNLAGAGAGYEPENGALASFLARRKWVIDLDEHAHDPQAYGGLRLPAWLAAVARAWLVVPLIEQERLLGFVVLQRSRTRPPAFNWEDCDVLKTAGRQAASHLAQEQAARALAEARQFETCNQLSAFMLHDLKNVVAQLSLLIANAGRHRDAPGFLDDAVGTIEQSVARMNRLLAQLRGGAPARPSGLVDLPQVLRAAAARRSAAAPAPELVHLESGIVVRADAEQLGAVLEHVIQNAQEATGGDGHVWLRLRRLQDAAVIEIEDNGCGMDEAFIRERLFRPFETTKGEAGMGLGAYECRELVRALGGRLEVVSAPGRGTTFRISLAMAPRAELLEVEQQACSRAAH
jgi:putative PEP-CTERM system histidine kinase